MHTDDELYVRIQKKNTKKHVGKVVTVVQLNTVNEDDGYVVTVLTRKQVFNRTVVLSILELSQTNIINTIIII